jgi:membrane-bound serine protease (ClpP class)
MLLAIVFLVLGLALVVAEIFFVSMGLLSVLAGAAILAADVLAFQESRVAGWTFIAAEVLLIPVIIRYAFKVLPSLPIGKRMLLQGPVTKPTGGFPSLEHLRGRHGTALTDLRPAGLCDFDGERVSVVSRGGFLARGTPLVAESVEGTEVRVRRLGPAPDPEDRP